MSKKNIDINQRIPLDTLEVALISFLDNNYSNDYIIEQLKLEFSGDNRLKKGLRIVNKIIPKNPLNNWLLENKEMIKSAIKKKVDRDIILISLLNSAFPFSYDVLQIFGKYFSAQDIINSDTIRKSISNIYGGNRATENGLYSVIPMFLEAKFFTRPKQGLYEWKEPLIVTSPITKKIYEESFKICNNTSEIHEHQKLDPYFLFVEGI